MLVVPAGMTRLTSRIKLYNFSTLQITCCITFITSVHHVHFTVLVKSVILKSWKRPWTSLFCFNDSSCMDSTSECKTCWLMVSDWLSQPSDAPMSVDWCCGEVTVEESPGPSGLLGLLWFFGSSSELWGVFGLVVLLRRTGTLTSLIVSVEGAKESEIHLQSFVENRNAARMWVSGFITVTW